MPDRILARETQPMPSDIPPERPAMPGLNGEDGATPVTNDTKHHRALGAAVGAGVETYSELADRGGFGGMGISNKKWRDYGNATIMLVIVIWMSIAMPSAFLWLRSDAKDDRMEYRQQVARTEQLAEERRREDRQDRQRIEDLFRTTLDTISRDSRESTQSMTKVYEQVKVASDQMKAASEAMTRVEKLLTTKLPPSERER